jgi:hypothetical protein
MRADGSRDAMPLTQALAELLAPRFETTMIDRKARDLLAENYRHLISGQITNDQFEDRLLKSKDAGVEEIFHRGAWPLYDDLHEHKLTGKWAIPKESKPIAARFILFLKTDLEYEWPRTSKLLNFGFLFQLKKIFRKDNYSVWPFYRRSDYEQALKSKPYLKGVLDEE